MTDAIISAVAQRLLDTGIELVRNEVNLVRGVEKDLLDLSNELKTIRHVLGDAEKRGFKDQTVQDWLKRLEYTCYEMDDVLDEWDYNLLEQQMEQQSYAEVAPKHTVLSFIPSPLSCLWFKKVSSCHRIMKKIQQVKAQLDRILKEKNRYSFAVGQPSDPSNGSWRVQSTSFVEVEGIYGREYDKDILMAKLTMSKKESGVQMISIVGLGGIGKTTLAQLVYNDNHVKDCFELRIWICVSNTFDLVEVAKGIVQNVRGISPDTNQLDTLLGCLKASVQDKKFLLVLDDVWTEDHTQWEPLKICLMSGMTGSKVLVTTRNERVAIMMGTMENGMHHLGLLSDDDCWLLMSRIALFGKTKEKSEKFIKIGKEIANKCKGLPLAIKTMGSLLRFKHGLEEWENVLESEIWEFKKTKINIFPHLLLSYNELSPTLKRCFSYCAVFRKDYEINVENLIRNWLALGYLGSNENSTSELELRGREYFDHLAMCSLFQDFIKDEYNNHVIVRFKLHDIVHDFAQFLQKNTSDDKVQPICQTCNPLLVSRVKEYRSLSFKYENVPYICDCFKKVRVLSVTKCGLESIPKGIEKLIHLRYLNLGGNDKLATNNLKIVCKLYNLISLFLYGCNLQEIPREIGKLIQLRHLDLSLNTHLKKLPESICDLRELRSLDLEWCKNLSGLPLGIHKLMNLKHLFTDGVFAASRDESIGQLSGLCTLTKFRGKLRCLKKLNQLSGSLQLIVPQLSSDEDVVEDAKGAELIKKTRLNELKMVFQSNMDEDVNEAVWMEVLNALQPYPNLSHLQISNYMGSKLANWITLPFNQLKSIVIKVCYLTSLPPLGKLACLEKLEVDGLQKLEFVGRDLLGITEDATNIASSSSSATGFPKLKILMFDDCSLWREWEDITTEEEASTDLSVFPCLKVLRICNCTSMSMLPHRLLRKASSLEMLHISGLPRLKRNYDKRRDGSYWKFISHIPQVKFQF